MCLTEKTLNFSMPMWHYIDICYCEGKYDCVPSPRYIKPLESFDIDVHSESTFEVDVLGKGQEALEEANKTLGWFLFNKMPCNIQLLILVLCMFRFRPCF